VDSFYTSVFAVGLVYTLFTTGVLVQSAVLVAKEWDRLDGRALDYRNAREGLARILEAPLLSTRPGSVQTAYQELQKKDWIDELLMDTEQRAAELLVTQQYLRQEKRIPQTDTLKPYLERSLAETLQFLVKIYPFMWLLLIPAWFCTGSMDVSSLAAASTSIWSSYPWTGVLALAVTGFSTLWGSVNFWKMAHIKSMIVPSVVMDPVQGEACVLPPRIDISQQRARFVSSPPDLEAWEDLFRRQDSVTPNVLYGRVGVEGSTIYRNSIQYHTWLVVASIVFYGTSIMGQDWSAVCNGVSSGSDKAMWELMAYGGLLGLNVLQLLVIPTTL
jgi:hypothetical protein